MAGLLAIFAEFEREILRERTRAGLAEARQNGKRLGRPMTAGLHAAEIRRLYRAGVAKAEIARRLEIGRTSVRHLLAGVDRPSALKLHDCRGTLMESDPYLDQLLRNAIQRKRLIRFVYKNKERIVEPHDYGIHKGVVKLLAYQVCGASSGKLPGWRWFEVSGMSGADCLPQTFPGNRPPPSGNHHSWQEIFARVEPAQLAVR